MEYSLKKKKLSLDSVARQHMSIYIYGLCQQRELGYANARTMKLLANAITDKYLLRVSRMEGTVAKTIIREDVKEFVWKQVKGTKKIGFR